MLLMCYLGKFPEKYFPEKYVPEDLRETDYGNITSAICVADCGWDIDCAGVDFCQGDDQSAPSCILHLNGYLNKNHKLLPSNQCTHYEKIRITDLNMVRFL